MTALQIIKTAAEPTKIPKSFVGMDALKIAGLMGASAVATKGVEKISDMIGSKLDERKYNGVINYARDKHPELKKVPVSTLKNHLDAFHVLFPKGATNKEMGATMLSTVNDYGGNIDLATAKLIADTGDKANKQRGGTDALGYISGASGVMKGIHSLMPQPMSDGSLAG